MNRRRFLTLLTAAAGWGLFSPDHTHAQISRVEAFLSQMTLRQKVGQLFLFSLNGTSFTEDMRRLIAERHAGGMVFFGYNIGTPGEVTQLINEMQRTALTNGLPIPLLTAVDQEGGRVMRLQDAPFSPFPSPMALGAADDPDLTFRVAAAIGEEMLACGLNLDLAPVLDVNTQPDNPVINVRSFGENPEKVAVHGEAFIQGLQSVGVAATGKHFPGHGSTSVDSHYDLPIVELDHDLLMQEMSPFRQGITAGVGAIMTAHVLYPALDQTPATFSKPIMTDLLRGEFGFQGVLISDALTMGAVSEARNDPAYVLRDTLLAGVDMLAYGSLPDGRAPTLAAQITMLEMVITLVESGLVDESRIDESVRKILNLKAHFGLLDWQPLDPATIGDRLKTAAHQALLTEVANRSVTLFSDGAGLLPLDPVDPLTILYPAELPQTGEALLSGQPNALSLAYPVSPDERTARRLANQVGRGKVVCLTFDTHRYPSQATLVNLLPVERTIIIAGQSPYDLLHFPQVQTYLMTYGISPQAMGAAQGVLFGNLTAQGKAPVSLL
jgi:beta-N-acetylhexosaminidase